MSTTQIVRCGECHRTLDESPGLDPAQRQPCPQCGSTRRFVEVGLQANANVIASLALEIRKSWYERSLPWLLALAALTVASGLIGGILLNGWASVGSSIAFSIASFFVGLQALTRVRSVERRPGS